MGAILYAKRTRYTYLVVLDCIGETCVGEIIKDAILYGCNLACKENQIYTYIVVLESMGEILYGCNPACKENQTQAYLVVFTA